MSSKAVSQFPFTRKDQLSPREQVGVSCPPGEDRARQEFKAEADVSTILKRFGAGQSFHATAKASGENDFDLDLMRAFEVVAASKEAWFRLPVDVRAKYRSWQELQLAVERGVYPPKAAEAPPASGGGSAASASDSAPVTPPKEDRRSKA